MSQQLILSPTSPLVATEQQTSSQMLYSSSEPQTPTTTTAMIDAAGPVGSAMHQTASDPDLQQSQPLSPTSQPSAATTQAPAQPAQSSGVVFDSLRKNGSISIDGELYRILEMCTSKTGKHGASRTYIAAEHAATGMKIERVIPTNGKAKAAAP